MTSALVSVVLPCFDAERFLPEALDSLLGQTHEELEILALDDGSTDGTPAILESYARRDARVRFLRDAVNRGLIATLNRGIAAAHADYVARMDSDDVAGPQRIARQLAVLEHRPEIDVVGTGIELIDEGGRPLPTPRVVRSRTPAGARFMSLFGPPVEHPTVLARTRVMREYPYGEGDASLHTEDYELWSRMTAAGIGFANVDEPLVCVRARAAGVSRQFEQVQVDNFVASARRHLERSLGIDAPPAVHRVLVNRIDASVGPRELAAGLRLLDRVESEFAAREPDSRAEIGGIADEQRVDILVQAALKGSPAVRAAAPALALRYARRLAGPRGRRYLALKARPSRLVGKRALIGG